MDDMPVCFFAHDHDAESVMEYASRVKSTKLLDLAAPIRVGSSDASDEAAMRQINHFCADSGYDYDRDGMYGRTASAAATAGASDGASDSPSGSGDQRSEGPSSSPADAATPALPIDEWGHGRAVGLVSRADLGEHWPFTVDHVTLHCVIGDAMANGDGLYVEVPDGRWYQMPEDSLNPGQPSTVYLPTDLVKQPADKIGLDTIYAALYGTATNTGTNDGGLCALHPENYGTVEDKISGSL